VKPEDTTTAVAPETRRRAVGASLGRTFVSLRVRNFRIFVAGQLLSASGTWMQSVAAPWLVLQLTHSGVALGVDTALQFLPILLFGAWGGVLADRFDKRKIQIFTQIAFAVPAFGLWALVVTHVVHVWMVYALSFVSGTVLAIDMRDPAELLPGDGRAGRPDQRDEPQYGHLQRRAADRPGGGGRPHRRGT